MRMQQQRKINAEWCWKCARNTYHHHQEQLQQVQQNVVCVMDLTKLRHACMKFTKFTKVTYSLAILKEASWKFPPGAAVRMSSGTMPRRIQNSLGWSCGPRNFIFGPHGFTAVRGKLNPDPASGVHSCRILCSGQAILSPNSLELDWERTERTVCTCHS